MRKKRLIEAALVTVFIFVFLTIGREGWPAENMLKNGDLEGEDTSEFSPTGLSSHYKFSIYTEDATGNKCARLEILNYLEGNQGAKGVNAGIVIGGAKGGDGQDGRMALDVKPNTTYEFSLDLKGTVNKVNISAFLWKGECNDYRNRARVASSLGTVKVQQDWVQYKGSFTTDAFAKKAALFVQVWCSEEYGLTEKPGTFLMVDNVVIREKSSGIKSESRADDIVVEKKMGVVARFEKESPKLDGRLDDAVWKNAQVLKKFFSIKGEEPAKVQTEGMVLATSEALWVGVRCFEPDLGQLKIKYKKDGEPVWQDDCVELFFDTRSEGITVRQFVVSAGGYRFMGWGRQPRQPSNYQDWKAAVCFGEKEWTAEIMLPYRVLGWDKCPPSGTAVGFNLCRERYASATEYSSWSPVYGNFHNKEKFGILVFGDFRDDIARRLKEVKSALNEVPQDIPEEDKATRAKIAERVGLWEQRCSSENFTSSLWEQAYLDIQQAVQQTKFLKLAGAKFAVTVVSPTDDFALPFIPDTLSLAPSVIEAFAAVNEYESLPIAITNLTNTTEAYRVILFGEEIGGIESPGLKGEKGEVFPSEAISLREAVRIRDSDAPIHGQRFDPLPLMNQGFTVTVPPRDSALIWITFNCKGITPGDYTGTLRIIPLNQSGKFVLKEGWQYTGLMKDIPLKLTVWPIELSEEPAIPLWLMREAENERFFIDMKEHGNQVFQVSPYYITTQFEPDGSVKQPVVLSTLDAFLDKHIRYFQEHKLEGHPKFLLGFSAYNIFEVIHAKKQFAFNTQAWEKAWTSWVKEVEKAFKKKNVDYQDYVVEVWDEPDWSKDFDQVIVSLKLAKQVCPHMQLQVTFGSSIWPVEKMKELVPYVDVWCPHDSYWEKEEYFRFFQGLKKQGKRVWFYCCDTNLSISLYQYYRLHGWKAWYRNVDIAGLFFYLTGPGGYYGRGCWKEDASGGLVYRSFDQPIPSIRYQCLREGFDDIKYLAKLTSLVSEAKEKRVDENLIKAAEVFLAQTPKDVVVNFYHEKTFAEESRRQAARLIIELQKSLKK